MLKNTSTMIHNKSQICKETYEVISNINTLKHSNAIDANNARKCNLTHRVFRPLHTIAATPIFNSILRDDNNIKRNSFLKSILGSKADY